MQIEGTICLQCGDKGFENAFVYCIRCLKFAVHRYCLDKIPDTFDEFVCWFCDDCKVKMGNQSAVFEHDAIPCQTRHNKVSKNIKRSSRDEKEKNGRVINGNEHVHKDGKHGANAILLPAGVSENVKGNLIECRIATTTYDEHTKIDINEGTRQGNDSTLPSKVKENEGCKQRDQTCITKTFESIADLGIVGANADHLIFSGDDKEKKKDQEQEDEDINEGMRPGIDSTLPTSMKENESCGQKDQTCVTKPFKSITDHLVISCDGASKSLSSSDDRIKSRGPEDKVEQTCASRQSRDKYVDYSVAQPIAIPVWRGSFKVRNSKHDSIDELVAHISNKACHKEMIHKELAFKGLVQNAELLIFTSTELPLRYWSKLWFLDVM
ncbi:hypothetical protein SASPL_104127 [Salvia splendens]|uniref:Zinc finger PHD-type domain-containing protein n=1 Tax=Salvia splendens TaxID=180675 RepID=A0A8X8YL20_SALSN|nr:hypothetical protein SASPL_104127 [Salvia splendens]